jgi:hypothetical protein
MLGAYSASTQYVSRDVVTYDGAFYIALGSVIGIAPVGNHSEFWSALVIVHGNAPGALSDDYIANADATVKAHHIDFGTNTDQVNASTIPYVSSVYATVGAALDALLFVPFSITSFHNDVGTVEIGTTVTSTTLDWVFNKDVVSQAVTPDIGDMPVDQRTATDTGAWTTVRTYALTASDGVSSSTVTSSISFLNKRYWGVSSASALDNSAILGLTSELASSKGQTRSMSPSGEYIYFAYPAAWGSAAFTVNGLLNTAWELAVVSFTNASGYTSNYNVYRSTYLLTGTYTIVMA